MQDINLNNLSKPGFLTNEAYKGLRTNILFCGFDVKVISVTSSIPHEGKSSVSFNLAASLAELGKQVLFVDADLRKSDMLERFKPDQVVLGLTHYLSGQKILEDIVYFSNVDNLDMIFSGIVCSNPAELLESSKFAEMIQVLREIYDYIIIDTPPLGSVVDGLVVAKQCDGTIMVIEANTISYRMAQKVKRQLEIGKCKIIGAVLNKVEDRGKTYEYY